MAITSGFFNAVAGDRLYNSTQISAIFDGIILDGVAASVGNAFVVLQDTGLNMKVSVGTGRAWFNHTWTLNDASILITLANAHALLNRFDIIYLEVNESSGVRANKVDKLAGTPATNPTLPALTNTSTVHQYPLAYVFVGAAVTKITQANIENKVGSVETPFISGPLGGVSVDSLLAQWEAQFFDWFNFLEDNLDENTEANLLAQIVAIVGNTSPPLINLIQLKSHDHIGGDGSQLATGAIQDSAITAIKIANRTRSFFLPAASMDEVGGAVIANINLIPTISLSGTIDSEYVVGSVDVPNDYVSDLIPIILWVKGSGSSASVRFRFDYGKVLDNVLLGTTNVITTTSVNSYGTNIVKQTLLTALQGMVAGAPIAFTIGRDTTHVDDTWASSISIVGIRFTYTADS